MRNVPEINLAFFDDFLFGVVDVSIQRGLPNEPLSKGKDAVPDAVSGAEGIQVLRKERKGKAVTAVSCFSVLQNDTTIQESLDTDDKVATLSSLL